MLLFTICAACMAFALPTLAGPDGYVFEALGEPVRSKALGIRVVTPDPDGYHIAWGAYEAPDGLMLLGVRLDNGELVPVNLEQFGLSHIRVTKGVDGNLYLYSGVPGHFLRYDTTKRELTDLGVPAKPASYWLGDAMGPDGRFWVGTYPKTHLVGCDTRTGEIEGHGQIADDERECYIIRTAVSDDNIVYCAVGLHHREMWAYDPQTKTKAQILPAELTQEQGAPNVWTGTDGQAYGQAGNTRFLCKPDGIEVCEPKPARGDPDRLRAGGATVAGAIEDGMIALTDTKTGEVRTVETAYQGSPNPIYCVACERNGRIYGGSGSGASTFAYNTATGTLTNLGRLTGGSIQVYDIMSLPQGLFLSSYMGATLDFYDPSKAIKAGSNPRRIGSPSGQERPVQWALGPDGMLYIGTVPVKGRLGGALVQVNPDDLTVKTWAQIIHNQSIVYVAPGPETNELFCASSVQGGSSAIPTETEACVFLWDIEREKVVFRARPVPGTRYYGRAVRANTGIIYGLAGDKYYGFDPVRREVVFVGDLPVKRVHFPGLNDEPVGERGLIYGLGDDAIFAIDPADHSLAVIARDESLKSAFGFLVTPDGVLYYGSGSTLWRCKLD